MRAKPGQQRLADEIEIYAAEQQPFCQILEILVKLLADESRFVVGSPVEPEALYRVDNADLYNRHAAGHRRVDSREMILNAGIFFVPRGLIVYRGGIVSLRLACHGNPRQVRHAHRDAESRLPVAVEFVSSEVKIPVCNAVKLGEHTFIAELMRGGLSLLRSRVFLPRAEHINAGQPERAV